MTDQSTQRRIVLAELPTGRLALRHFTTEVVPVPTRSSGEVLLRSVLAQIAPATRAVMQGPTYRPRLAVGEVIPALAVAEIVDGTGTGGLVTAEVGWQEYVAVPASEVQPVPAVDPPELHLGLLGLNGLTAYFGVREVARVRPGDTVVVSGAAGGVGHLAGQLARLAGARVVGVTGAEAKMDILKGKLGFHGAVNRRSATFRDDLRAACPEGVDVYYDNTAGQVLEAVLPLVNRHARIVCCGGAAQYDLDTPPPGSPDLTLRMVVRSLRMQGFLVMDYEDLWDAARSELRALRAAGELTTLDDIRIGLESAPAALVDMMAGGNVGQLSVRVAPDPAR